MLNEREKMVGGMVLEEMNILVEDMVSFIWYDGEQVSILSFIF